MTLESFPYKQAEESCVTTRLNLFLKEQQIYKENLDAEDIL